MRRASVRAGYITPVAVVIAELRQWTCTLRQRQPYPAWQQLQLTYAALASVNVSVAPAPVIIAKPASVGEYIALGIGIFDAKYVAGRLAGTIFWDPVRCLYAEPGDDELNSLSQDEPVVCCCRATISKGIETGSFQHDEGAKFNVLAHTCREFAPADDVCGIGRQEWFGGPSRNDKFVVDWGVGPGSPSIWRVSRFLVVGILQRSRPFGGRNVLQAAWRPECLG